MNDRNIDTRVIMRERFVEQKHMYESSESARIGEKQAYLLGVCQVRLLIKKKKNY